MGRWTDQDDSWRKLTYACSVGYVKIYYDVYVSGANGPCDFVQYEPSGIMVMNCIVALCIIMCITYN